MGYRISWLAVEGVGKERLLGALRLIDTGEPDEANVSEFSIAELPTGWVVLWSNNEDYGRTHARGLSRELAPILAVSVNETCMHSTAVLFDNGSQRWRVHHEGDERIDFLETEGHLPVWATGIEARLRASQVEEDAGAGEVDHLFDVPLEIAKVVCGYKHDETRFAWGEPEFTVVSGAPLSEAVRAPTFWQRLTGRA